MYAVASLVFFSLMRFLYVFTVLWRADFLRRLKTRFRACERTAFWAFLVIAIVVGTIQGWVGVGKGSMTRRISV